MRTRGFEDRTVYVVGASMGIGLAVATRLAGAGAHVALFARRPAPLAAAAAAVAAARVRPTQVVTHHPLDATDPAAVAAVLDAVVAARGTPDVLMNCVGRARPDYFERISYERFAETLRVNLDSAWNIASTLVPHMKRRGRGHIVNTASLAGLLGVFGYTDYCAAKFAVIGFSEALRAELAPHGIAVSVLCPPDTDTPGFAEENRGKPPETHAVSAEADLLTADAVADALLAGLRRRAFLIVPGRSARLAVLAKRLAPGVVQRIMDRQVRRAARRHPGG